MAITARELVFFIRAENQASGVLRKVARDIRALPSTKTLRIQQEAAQQTVRNVTSGKRVLAFEEATLSTKKKSLATQKAIIDGQLRQASIANRYNRVQDAQARNARDIRKASERTTKAFDTIQDQPRAAAASQAEQSRKAEALRKQIRDNATAVSAAEQAVKDSESKLKNFPTLSPAQRTVTGVERQSQRVLDDIAKNAQATALARQKLESAQFATKGFIPSMMPASVRNDLQAAQGEVIKLEEEGRTLSKQLDEVRITATAAAEALSAGMDSAANATELAKEKLATLNKQTETLASSQVQLGKDAELAAEKQVAAANAARVAYELEAASLEILRVKQIELANAEAEVVLQAKAEALARSQALQDASIAKINAISGAFNRLGRTIQIAGVISAVGIGLLAKSAANFQSQLTLAATQARKPGESSATVPAIAAGLNEVVLKQMKEFPAASKDMANSLYEIFSGTNVQNIGQAAKLLHTFNMMAVAGGTDLNTMTQAGISLFNNFVGVGREFRTLTGAANVFFAAVRYGRMNATQFAQSLNNVIPIAKLSGESFKSVADAMATLTRKTGASFARTDAMGLARLIQLFDRPEMIAGLHKYGVEVKDLATGKMRPLLKIIEDIKTTAAFKGLKPGPELLNFFKTISAAGGNGSRGFSGTINAQRAFGNLITDVKEYHKVSGLVNNDNSEFANSFNAMIKSPGVRFKVLTNQLKAIAIVLGEQAIPAFVKFAGVIEKPIHWFEKLSSSTKKSIGEWLVYGSISAIVGGGILRLASTVAQLGASMTIMRRSQEASNLAKLGTEAGGVTGKLGLMLGPLALVVAAFVLWPHQTMAVINALGGFKAILGTIALIFIGMKLGVFFLSMVEGWRAVAVGAEAAAVATAGMAVAEDAAAANAVVLDVALAPLIGPFELLGALAGLAAGFLFMGFGASNAASNVDKLKKSLNQAAQAAKDAPRLHLAVDEAAFNLKHARDELAKTKKGTYEWQQAVFAVRDAYYQLKDAEDAAQKNYSKGTHAVADQFKLIKNAQKDSFVTVDALKRQFRPGAPDSGQNPAVQAAALAKAAAAAIKDWQDKLDGVGLSEEKLHPLQARNIELIAQFSRLIDKIPPDKVMKIILDNKNADANLKDFIDKLPTRYKELLQNAGVIMGKDQADAWINAIQTQFDNNPLTATLLINTKKLPHAQKDVPFFGSKDPKAIAAWNAQQKREAAAAAKAAAAVATNNAAYLAALHKVAQLQTIADKDKPGTPQWLKDTSAFNAALAALNNSYKQYQSQTSAYLSAVEAANTKAATDTAKKAKTAAEKAAAAAKKAAAEAGKAWTAAAQSIQSSYQSIYQQQQSAFGTIFNGPYINSPRVQNKLQWGGKVTGQDLFNDLRAQIAQYKLWNHLIERLANKKNVPWELIQQIRDAGPGAINEVKALLSLRPAKLQKYFSMFRTVYGTKGKGGLIEKFTKSEFKGMLAYYRSFGRSIALAIIQGLQDPKTPSLKWFEALIKSWFPALAKAAKDAPAPVDKHGGHGPKNPGKVPPVKQVHPGPKTGHPPVYRRTSSARLTPAQQAAADNAADWGSKITYATKTKPKPPVTADNRVIKDRWVRGDIDRGFKVIKKFLPAGAKEPKFILNADAKMPKGAYAFTEGSYRGKDGKSHFFKPGNRPILLSKQMTRDLDNGVTYAYESLAHELAHEFQSTKVLNSLSLSEGGAVQFSKNVLPALKKRFNLRGGFLMPQGYGKYTQAAERAGYTWVMKKQFVKPERHLYKIPGKAPGMIHQGNIDLLHRKVAHLANGMVATVHSFSVNFGKGEVLLSQVINGKLVSQAKAIAYYKKTGKNLGIFDTPAHATAYSLRLQKEQAALYAKTIKEQKDWVKDQNSLDWGGTGKKSTKGGRTDTIPVTKKIEEHTHYHVTAPQNADIEAQLRRAHFRHRNQLRLDK